MMEVSKKKIWYINLVFLITLAAMLIFTKWYMDLKPKEAKPVRKEVSSEARVGAGAVVHDMSRFMNKGELDGSGPGDLGGMYKKFPKEDVGDNIVEGWANVSAGDKAQFLGGLDGEITKAKAALAENPEDKNAKALLLISERLKNMAARGFNCKIKKQQGL